MREIHITTNEADQRLDKLLSKYLNLAPKSFIYKMLRKKNIVLNDKKATGNEKLQVGDSVKLYLADETINNFMEKPLRSAMDHHKKRTINNEELHIIYEDDDILLVNKPVGVLSQKAESNDYSINEQIIDYLIASGSYTEEQQRFFTPSVCNRLDRNTSGIIAAGKTLSGSQFLSQMFRERQMRKYYYCIVKGKPKDQHVKGYLTKNNKTNKVQISANKISKDSTSIETAYKVIESNKMGSLLEVHLITGKPHQIRAHLASLGCPIAGDHKYGDSKYNEYFKKKYQLKNQLLHACRLEMPVLNDKYAYLSEKIWYAKMPSLFEKILQNEIRM